MFLAYIFCLIIKFKLHKEMIEHFSHEQIENNELKSRKILTSLLDEQI